MVVAFSTGAALLFILAEFLFSRKKNSLGYRYENTVANLSVGICERLINLFMAPLFYGLFDYIFRNYAAGSIAYSWQNMLLLLLITDFIWFWYHRLGHRVNLFWAAHIVHHQSPDFNLSAAARITIFQAYVRTLFWCLLPFAGFPPEMVRDILLIHGTYSFFTHTEIVGKLGILEYILVTPSHHRVHHASNSHYLDKNYGDVFIFWDKLFGTFAQEDERPVYGLTQPLTSYSFLWQHFHYYAELFVLASRQKSLREKTAVWFSPPETMDPRIRPVLERELLGQRRKTLNPVIRIYNTLQIVMALAVLLFLCISLNQLSTTAILLLSGFILTTLIISGAIMEQKSWAFNLELFRSVIIAGIICLVNPMHSLLLMIILCMMPVFLLRPLRNWYFKQIAA